MVRVFMAELGLTMDQDTVDIMAGENRQPAYQALNPGAQLPALMLDDGTIVSEITAICEYLAEHAGAAASSRYHARASRNQNVGPQNRSWYR